MKAVFVELPPFCRFRQDYLDDEEYCMLQTALMSKPAAGDVVPGSGGLRKVRHGDSRRGLSEAGCALSITGGHAAHSFGCSFFMTKTRQAI